MEAHMKGHEGVKKHMRCHAMKAMKIHERVIEPSRRYHEKPLACHGSRMEEPGREP